MDCSMPGLPVYHQLLELTQTHVHQVSDAIQPSHPLPDLQTPKLPVLGKIPNWLSLWRSDFYKTLQKGAQSSRTQVEVIPPSTSGCARPWIILRDC